MTSVGSAHINSPALMNHIGKVIKETATPSWMGSVPSNFGHAAAGSLKADKWRTFATIYLPLALISFWGFRHHDSPEVKAQLLDILDHTMSLVCLVYLACKRSINQARATDYRNLLIEYVRNLKTLHPHANYRPNHHAAFHIYDFLLLFEPVRSWWCFPFERLIGHLQRLPSNHIFGTSPTFAGHMSLIKQKANLKAHY
jgi:hypothetical protein